MEKPRAFTKDELRDKFLDHIKNLVTYYSELKDRTEKEKLQGLAFSILCTFDGVANDFPCMDILMHPHEDDKQYHIDNEENWIEHGTIINDTSYLHDLIKFD